MKKIFVNLILILMLSNCGYAPIYSNKNFNFDLNKITKKENSKLNSNIAKNLRVFSNADNPNKIYLKLDSKKVINIIAKDKKGNPSRYDMSITMIVDVEYRENKTMQKTFTENFNYNTSANKFELSQYEKEIEELLIDKIIEDCITYLSKI
tara:strand:- start:3031 stop:3483 length:453 start_codon:yes stop_codon:yes gene_type:complete